MGLLTIDTTYVYKKKIVRESGLSVAHAAILGLSLIGLAFGNLGVIL